MSSIGHAPPRGSFAERVSIADYAALAPPPTYVILRNGRVSRLMKILEIRGFAFSPGTLIVRVSLFTLSKFSA